MTLLCIIPGPSEVLATEPDDRQTRWCFTCRARVPHTYYLLGDPPPRNEVFVDWPELDGYAAATIRLASYYDPSWSLRCPSGHSDTYFPGCGPL